MRSIKITKVLLVVIVLCLFIPCNFYCKASTSQDIKEQIEETTKTIERYEVEIRDIKQEIFLLKVKLENEKSVLSHSDVDIKKYIEYYSLSIVSNQVKYQELIYQLDKQEEKLEELRTCYSKFMSWPAPDSHYLTSYFGWRIHPIYDYEKYHSGIDIGASYGTNVLAADGGTVIISDYDAGGYGNYVVISHGNELTTLCGHMSTVYVSAGDTVSQGDVIGLVGSTGASTGPHLHFEVAINNECVDPLNYVIYE